MPDVRAGLWRLAGAASISLVLAGRGNCQVHIPHIACRPSELRSGDTLVLILPHAHPPEVAITAPDDNWYRIVTSDSTGPYRSVIPQRAFLGMDTLRLPVGTLRAVPYPRGAGAPQLIFSQSGTYTIDLGERLQSEGRPVFNCRVRYTAPARPAEPPSRRLQRGGAGGLSFG